MKNTPKKPMKLAPEVEEKMNEQRAKMVLEDEKKKRAQACTEELQGLMKKYNCSLDPQVLLRANAATQVLINIVAN